MNKVLLTAITLVSVSAATWAVAGSQDQGHAGGFYAGAGVGAGNLVNSFSTSSIDGISTRYSDSTDFNFAARAEAGYLFGVTSNLLVGAEVGYNYFPKTKLADVTFNGKSSTANITTNTNAYVFDALGVAKYFVTENFNVFGKAGLAYVHTVSTTTTTLTDSSVTPATVTVTTEKSKNDAYLPEVAAGVGYNITPALEATVAYNHAFGTGDDNNPGYNMVLAGLDYHFSL